MLLDVFICPICSDAIYARCRHDVRNCHCGNLSVDGGLTYTRRSYKRQAPIETQKSVQLTAESLSADWASGKNVFGKYVSGRKNL